MSKSSLLLLLMLAACIFLLSFAATAWHLDRAPDLFADEILYTRAGIRLAGEGALVWDSGAPIYVHPPLYFVAEAAYLGLSGGSGAPLYAAGDIFAAVYQARYLNALLAGLTAALLYVVGWRLRGHGLGLLLALLFLLDPFGLRTNRRAMLETMAALLVLAGLGILLPGGRRLAAGRADLSKISRAVVGGLLLGAALLTKELAFTSLLAMLLFALWELWRWRRGGEPGSAGPAFLAVTVAGLTYAVYPGWMLIAGQWPGFAEVKWLSLQRLAGLVQISGWNRPGLSLSDLLAQRLVDYGSSFGLLALGGVALVWLLLRRRHAPAGRLLGSWGLVVYPFYGFVALFGSGNDQFFYFLLVPAIVLVGYAATEAMRKYGDWRPGLGLGIRIAGGLALALLLSYNGLQWWTAYGRGVDDGYRKLATYVQANLPPGEPLNATGDALKFYYFFPERPIATAGTPAEAQAVGAYYFALAPKDLQGRYGRITPELATWIQTKGQRLFAVSGDSHGQILLYRVDYPPGPSSAAAGVAEARPRQRQFGPAQGGFVGGFVLALALWCGLLVVLTLALAWLQVRLRDQPALLAPRVGVPGPRPGQKGAEREQATAHRL